MKKQRYHVMLTPAMLAALAAEHERSGVPKAEQIRRAIQAWLAQREGGQDGQRRR